MAAVGSKPRAIVIKVGGSFLLKDGSPNVDTLKEIAGTVHEIVEKGFRVVCVVGGGICARQYIAVAEALGANNGVKDLFGILVSRLNARLFIEAYGDGCYSNPIEHLNELRTALQTRNVVCLGGLQPGQSTTAVAALAGEFVSAEAVIFGTDVDGVYTADPNKDPNAKKIDCISYNKLRDLSTGEDNILPGQYRLMDGVCLTILQRDKLKAVILKGNRENYLAAVNGEKIGTLVSADAE
mmetsp:Transcript_30048/g.41516  ORF Transcript_30048/g.41516 Transcript_30048/m.41516 type:complete len:239 (+) Transcript_30048:67-783(+)|eukprot:CAMPEP_0201475408 /NCGR_PEP_ID=MMETSP0151_2-20130828/830_1 /ASSEMBLY_ACC=CAM_ASM_000257 /TAXON_ID=200890 /ORGANISM="Paramoeba atlantica, Strain 621/1 / CCAP 1560/9" /LENGTH=238 /DNA_ID=CAMNT_0047855485 /DNA_START=52 /DNA_END=768 /DNA_ORIENTATION=-